MLPAAISLGAQQYPTQSPWHHTGFPLASVLKEGTRHHRYSAGAREASWASEAVGAGVRGGCTWKQPPHTGTKVWWVHPGALSSCCVCASFFCAPHRCYENLRSPAGKVTSAQLVLPFPRPQPRAAGGGWPLPASLAAYMASGLSFLSPPSSFPLPLPPVLAHCSEFSLHFPPLFCQRDTWRTLPTQENDLGLLAPPLMSLFRANTGFWVFYLPGSEEGVANSHSAPTCGGAMPSSRSHKATPMAGPGRPYSFLWPGTDPAWLGWVDS